ncbi:unnamed protein product [Ranitomeya imitator]|uniref:Uncharacterized protein n=1 Tax=Ranitomeya imitator TaxID=111125 RepID=A0ABN9KUC8_9NEOB|nr:unnamed protein product [Ranitomeya imitator]
MCTRCTEHSRRCTERSRVYEVYGALPRVYEVYGALPRVYEVYGALPRVYEVYGAQPRVYEVYGAQPRVYEVYGVVPCVYEMYGEEPYVYEVYAAELCVCKPREEMVFSGKTNAGEQILRLTNERFAVPEILLHPSDIGIQEMGIPEAIVHSVHNLPEEMQPHFFKNIVLTGGNALFPGFKERVYSEVRKLTPTDYDVSVILPKNPITYSWEGGKLISENDDFEDMVVTREDYEENGHEICEEKFDI